MSSTILYVVLAAVLALVVGIVVGRQLAGKARQDHEGEAQARARQIIEEADIREVRFGRFPRASTSRNDGLFGKD